MAHYIAELMSRAEASSGEEGEELRERCRIAILDLWAHRAYLPGRPPLVELEPIRATLQALQPEEKSPFYRQEVLRLLDDGSVERTTADWLRLALGLDFAARLLISEAIDQAAARAADKAAEWVKAASPAIERADVSLQLAILLQSRSDENTAPTEAHQERLQDRLKKLDAFLETAKAYRKILADQTAALDT